MTTSRSATDGRSAVPPPPAGGSITLTPVRALAVAAVLGALSGWLLVVVADAVGALAPQVPWTTPVALVLVAALVGTLAYTTHQRIQVRHHRVEPQRAVAFLVLGKASALAGAVVVGGYLAFALMFVSRMEADLPRERVIRSAIAVVAGVALSVAGLRLERACKVPGVDDEDDDAAGDTTD